MKLLPNARTKRHAALAVLMLWLFAIATGWANACVLEARGTHVHAAAADASEGDSADAAADAPQAVTVSAGHVSVLADHDEHPDVSKAPCLKVCDDGSTSVVQLHPGLDLTDPGTAPLAIVLWTALAPAESALRPWDDLPPPEAAGPPPRIRFSRLAL